MQIRRLTIDRLNDYGCANIIYAMVRQMSREYRGAMEEYEANPDDPVIREQYQSVREEFLSDYFAKLTGIVGSDIVKRLDSGYTIGSKMSKKCGMDIA